MAELRDLTGSDRHNNRGQLILVTGFVLAIVLVALVLLLNTTIYTENIASRGLDRSPEEAVEYREAVRDGVGDLLVESNDDVANNSTTMFTDSIGNLSDIITDVYADRGTVVVLNTSKVETTDGTFIWQGNTTTFANATIPVTEAPKSWTVAENVDAARAVRLNVTDDKLWGDLNESETFHIKLNDPSGGEWSAFIYLTGGDVTVTSRLNGVEQATCSATGSTVQINLSEGTVGGEPCSGLLWGKGFNTEYDIEFVNPSNVQGTYNMTLRGAGLDETEFGTNGSVPQKRPVLYSATIPIYYQTSTLTYETNITVAPGAPES